MRDAVLAAYDEYLDAVLGAANHLQIEAIAEKHDLPAREHCGQDWRALYDGTGGPSGVQGALAELCDVVATCNKKGEKVRLLCHCCPKACHTAALARRVVQSRAPLKDSVLATGPGAPDVDVAAPASVPTATSSEVPQPPTAMMSDEEELARRYNEVLRLEEHAADGNQLAPNESNTLANKTKLEEELLVRKGNLPSHTEALECGAYTKIAAVLPAAVSEAKARAQQDEAVPSRSKIRSWKLP